MAKIVIDRPANLVRFSDLCIGDIFTKFDEIGVAPRIYAKTEETRMCCIYSDHIAVLCPVKINSDDKIYLKVNLSVNSEWNVV